MKQLKEDIRLILKCSNVNTFDERKAYNRLLDFTVLESIYQGIPCEDSEDSTYPGQEINMILRSKYDEVKKEYFKPLNMRENNREVLKIQLSLIEEIADKIGVNL